MFYSTFRPARGNKLSEFRDFNILGIEMTGVSKTSLLNFVVFPGFLALTVKVWQVNDHHKREELTINYPKLHFSEVGIERLGLLESRILYLCG